MRPTRRARQERRAHAATDRAQQLAGGGGTYDWLWAALTAALLLTVYAFTAPRTVIFEDDGLFIMAGVTAGVAHPPGYPLYTVLGYLASMLPFLQSPFLQSEVPPALAIHLLSGLLGAMACGLLFFIARHCGISRLLSMVTALSYGVSEHFWSQTIIAEVYSLNVLLTFAVLLLCLKAAAQPIKRGQWPQRELQLAAVCFGLGLANHWPLLLLAAPAFVILLWPQLRAWRLALSLKRLAGLTIIALGTAGVLYLWMVWRSWQPELIAFYGPIDSFKDFWYYVSRQGYGGVDSSASAGIADKLGFASYFAGEALRQYTLPMASMALYGIYCLHSEGRGRLLTATAWIFLAHSLLLILYLGFDYEYLNVAVFRPYPLVAYGILALWMGYGLNKALHALGALVSAPWLKSVAFKGLPVLALLLPVFLLQQNLPHNDRSDDDFADRYGRMMLNGLEPNAVLFVVGDTTTSPLGYLHFVEGVRPDILLINTQGLVYPSRLFVPPTTSRRRQDAFAAFMRQNQANARRPVYTINANDDIPNPNGTVHYGFYQKIDPAGAPSAITLLFNPEVVAYFRSLIDNPPPSDRWNRHQYGVLLQQFGNFLGYTAMSPDPSLAETSADLVAALQEHYYGLTAMAEILIEHGRNAQHLQIAEGLLNQAEPLYTQEATLSKSMHGRHHYRRGFLYYRQGRNPEAIQQFRLSLRVHNHPDNHAQEGLRVLGAQQ